MNGVVLAEHVAAVASNIPVIFFSGYPEQFAGPLEKRGCTFIRKPFRASELLGTVRETLDRQSAA